MEGIQKDCFTETALQKNGLQTGFAYGRYTSKVIDN